jgi:hypothetical protein
MGVDIISRYLKKRDNILHMEGNPFLFNPLEDLLLWSLLSSEKQVAALDVVPFWRDSRNSRNPGRSLVRT